MEAKPGSVGTCHDQALCGGSKLQVPSTWSRSKASGQLGSGGRCSPHWAGQPKVKAGENRESAVPHFLGGDGGPGPLGSPLPRLRAEEKSRLRV